VTSQITWYAARAAGIVAWALAAASVIWGLALSTRVTKGKPRPAWLFDLHRFLGGTALIFTVIHVAAILLDSYVHFSLLNVLVPLTGTWHPVAVAGGIVGLYLLAAVELTSLAKARVSKRVWRRVHFASFALYAVSTIHGLTAGTDRHSLPLIIAMAASTLLVVELTVLRVVRSISRPPSVQTARRVPVVAGSRSGAGRTGAAQASGSSRTNRTAGSSRSSRGRRIRSKPRANQRSR
jgi:predicted ferric reductase